MTGVHASPLRAGPRASLNNRASADGAPRTPDRAGAPAPAGAAAARPGSAPGNGAYGGGRHALDGPRPAPVSPARAQGWLGGAGPGGDGRAWRPGAMLGGAAAGAASSDEDAGPGGDYTDMYGALDQRDAIVAAVSPGPGKPLPAGAAVAPAGSAEAAAGRSGGGAARAARGWVQLFCILLHLAAFLALVAYEGYVSRLIPC